MLLMLLGMALLSQDAHSEARALLVQSLNLFRQLGSTWGIAWCLDGLARLAGEQGQAERAAQLWGKAEDLREVIRAPLTPDELVTYQRYLATVRDRPNKAQWEAAWATGRTFTVEEAITLAKGEGVTSAQAFATLAPTGHLPSIAIHLAGLTPREDEVLRLAAAGLSNARIGDALFISSRTVQTHLTSVYAKLGVSSKTAAARWAFDHGVT
jgi:DNA-binding CsgD family transcriptional regulator